jgi:LPS sulfotransferase NodH
MHNPLSVKKFVILAMPRTGSNMLCTMLNSHSDILCHHELYNPREIFYALQLRGTDFKLSGKRFRNKYPLQFLSKVWHNDLGYPYVGFKMTGRQNTTVLNAVLHDATIKKIILKRHNRVKTFVSKLIAQQCGIWEDYFSEPAKERNQK